MLTALRHPACAGQQRRLSGHGQPLTDASGFHTSPRRKLLRGVLVRMAGGKQDVASRDTVASVYETMGFDESVRAEEISPDAFVRLEQAFFERRSR